MLESRFTSPSPIAPLNDVTFMPLRTLSASLGPMPLTPWIILNNSRSASVAKPYSVCESSRTTSCVLSVTAWPSPGSFSNDDNGISTSYPMPLTSTTACVGSASVRVPFKKVIMPKPRSSRHRVTQGD